MTQKLIVINIHADDVESALGMLAQLEAAGVSATVSTVAKTARAPMGQSNEERELRNAYQIEMMRGFRLRKSEAAQGKTALQVLREWKAGNRGEDDGSGEALEETPAPQDNGESLY